MDWEQEKREILAQFTDFDLKMEIGFREKEGENVTIDGIYVEYTCPICKETSQVPMDEFTDDGIWEGECQECDREILLDLEEN